MTEEIGTRIRLLTSALDQSRLTPAEKERAIARAYAAWNAMDAIYELDEFMLRIDTPETISLGDWRADRAYKLARRAAHAVFAWRGRE